jgi:hypothetical protein
MPNEWNLSYEEWIIGARFHGSIMLEILREEVNGSRFQVVHRARNPYAAVGF